MDKAKAAVSSFIKGAGHHDTTVDESVAPAVTQEHVKPTRHEEVQEAVDREVHQDHYHTTVQPVQHQEVLPEQHTHNMGPVQERQFEHDDVGQTKQKLESEAARFRDTSTTHETRHTTSAAPAVEGEHVHHHVHERVQPIVHKETVQPEVVHTTVPIHEVHKAESEHHGISTLPVKTLDEFKSGGGILTGGQKQAHESYEGDPRPYNAALQADRTDADTNFHAHDGLHDHQRALGRQGGGTNRSGIGGNTDQRSLGSNTTSGPHSSNFENKVDPRVDSDRDGRSGLGATGTESGLGSNTAQRDLGSNTTAGPHDSNIANTIDPRVDAHGGSSAPSDYRGAEAATGLGATGAAAGAYGAGSQNDRDTLGSSPLGQDSTPSSGFNEHSLGQDASETGTGIGGIGSNNSQPGALANDPTAAGSQPRQDTSYNPDASSRSGLQDSSNTNTTSGQGLTGNQGAISREADTPNTRSNMADEEPQKDTPQAEGTGDKDQQSADQGRDPNVIDDKSKKLTGTGAPGSHSALFGLTPDGHKETEADSTTTAPTPAHSGTKKSATGDGGENTTEGQGESNETSGDTGSRQPEGSNVQGQLNDPKVAQKGHGGDETTAPVGDADKPGSGGSLTTPSQGSGEVGQGSSA